jgi:hypothetical protein
MLFLKTAGYEWQESIIPIKMFIKNSNKAEYEN